MIDLITEAVFFELCFGLILFLVT